MFRKIAALLRRIDTANSTAALASLGPDMTDFEREETRRAVAAALTRNSVELDHCRRLRARIADYEVLFDQALQVGNVDLARSSATELAKLEAERAVCEKAQKAIHAEIDRLKTDLRSLNGAQPARREAMA